MSNQLVKADALQRGIRTFWQGIAIDALYAVGAGLAVLLLGGPDVLSGAFWAAAGVLVLKSFLTALASFLQRLKSEPKPLPVEPPEAEQPWTVVERPEVNIYDELISERGDPHI